MTVVTSRRGVRGKNGDAGGLGTGDLYHIIMMTRIPCISVVAGLTLKGGVYKNTERNVPPGVFLNLDEDLRRGRHSPAWIALWALRMITLPRSNLLLKQLAAVCLSGFLLTTGTRALRGAPTYGPSRSRMATVTNCSNLKSVTVKFSS
jgi:hypothetical protein